MYVNELQRHLPMYRHGRDEALLSDGGARQTSRRLGRPAFFSLLLGGLAGCALAACGGAPVDVTSATSAAEPYAFRLVGTEYGDPSELHAEGVYDPETQSGAVEAGIAGTAQLEWRQLVVRGKLYFSLVPDSRLALEALEFEEHCRGKLWVHMPEAAVDELGDFWNGPMRPDPERLVAALADDPEGFTPGRDESVQGESMTRYDARQEYLRDEGRRLLHDVPYVDEEMLSELTLWTDSDGRLRRAAWTGDGELREMHATLEVVEYGVPRPSVEPPESSCRWSGPVSKD